MVFIRRTKVKGKYYYSLCERVKTPKGWRTRAIQSFGSEMPIRYIPILLQGDVLEVIPHIPDKSVDLVIADPPYRVSTNANVVDTRGKKRRVISSNFGKWDWFYSDRNFWDFTFSWLDLAVEKLRDGGILIMFFDKDKINFISNYLQQKHGFKFKCYFAWIKSNPPPQMRKVGWQNGWEIAGIWQKPNGKLTFNYKLGQHPDYLKLPIVAGKERTKHPTQKPEKIIDLFIKYWSKKGDIVLSLFSGSGTDLVCAFKNQRQCLGIEMNKDYIEIINLRMKAEFDKIGKHIKCRLINAEGYKKLYANSVLRIDGLAYVSSKTEEEVCIQKI